MTESLSDEQKDRIYFMTLVQTYQQMAWIAMGKLANPATQKTERDIGQASWAIDMLATLERLTKGNVPAEDTREIGQIVYMLRMNYVEEAAKPEEKPSAEGQEEADAAKPEPDEAEAPPESQESPAEHTDAPKEPE